MKNFNDFKTLFNSHYEEITNIFIDAIEKTQSDDGRINTSDLAATLVNANLQASLKVFELYHQWISSNDK